MEGIAISVSNNLGDLIAYRGGIINLKIDLFK